MPRSRQLSFLLALVVPVLACKATEPDPIGPCVSSVEVEVGPGTEPVFSWTPRCTVLVLSVDDTVEGGITWSVIQAVSGIAPGLRYGTVPTGGFATSAPPALQPGVTYRVSLLPFTEADEDFVGEALFTP